MCKMIKGSPFCIDIVKYNELITSGSLEAVDVFNFGQKIIKMTV